MLKRLLSIVIAASMILTMFGTSAVNAKAETIQHGNIQAEIFVSPTGNDENPGTYEQPLATLDGARKAVAKINSNMTGDIYVFFAAGDYYITNTVEFGVADSGTNGFNIIYREMDGLSTVNFIGGEKIDPNSWTLVDGLANPTTNPDGDLPDSISGMVYKTFVGTGDYPSKNFNTLYVDDSRQVMARSPNLNKRPGFPSSFSDYYKTTGGGAGGSNATSMTFNDSILDANTRTGMINAMARGDFDAQVFTDDYGGDRHWESNTLMLSSYTPGKFTFKNDPAKLEFNRPRFTVGDRSSFFVQGNLGFLDQAGEFYYNKTTGYLYYYPTGEITQLDVIIPKVETIVLLKGNDKDNTVHNIQFNGIKFADTNFPDWYSPYWNWGDTGTGMKKYPPVAMNSTNPSYAEGVDRPQFQVGVIKMNYASFINIERSHIKNGGMNGISLYLANHNITIRDSLIEHVGHDGIQIEGGYPGDPINGGINGEGYSRDNLIENVIIHDVGELVLCSAGISLNNAGRNTVKHVEIYNSPRRGLLLQAGNARNPNNEGGFGDKSLNRYNDFYIHNNRFEYVYVHDTQQDGGDDGALFVGWIYRGNDAEPNYKRNYFEQVIIDQNASNPTMTNYTPNNINTDMGANGLSFKNVMSTNSQNFNFEGGSYFQAAYGDKALISDNTNLNYGPRYDQDATFDPSKMELDKIGVTAAYPVEYKTPLVATDKPTDIYFADSFEDKEIDLTKWNYQNKLPKTTSLYMAGTPLQDSRSLMIDDSGSSKPVLYKEFPQALNKVVSVKMFDPFAVNPTGYDSGRPFNMKNFNTMVRADDGEKSRAIGINANSGSANFNNYVLNIDGVEHATAVKRTNGWRELKWDYTETGVTMYIDDVQVYQDTTALPFDYLQLGSLNGTGASWLDQVYVYGGTPAPALDSIPIQTVPAYDASNENKTRLDLNFEDGVVPSFSVKGGIAPVSSIIDDPENSSNKVMQTVIGDGQSYYQTSADWNNYIVNMKWKFVGWGSTNILGGAYDNFTIYINTNGNEPNPPAYQVIYRRNKGGVTGYPAGTPFFEVNKHTPTSDVSLGRVAVPVGFDAAEWHDFQIQTYGGKVGFVVDGTQILSVNDGAYSTGGVAFGGINSTVLLDDIKIISNPTFVNYGTNFNLGNVSLLGTYNPNYTTYGATINDKSQPVTLILPKPVLPGVSQVVSFNGVDITANFLDYTTAVALPNLENGRNKLVISEITSAGRKDYSIYIDKTYTISSVVEISPLSTVLGTAPVLPTTTDVTFEDGTNQTVAISWDRVSPAAYKNTTGTFTVNGQLVGLTGMVSATVNVVGMESLSELEDVVTTAGTAPLLADTVSAQFTDGSRDLALTFAAFDPAMYAEAGTIIAVANVEGYPNTILQKVIVEAITTVDKATLSDLIAHAESMYTNEEDYTADTWATLQEALTAAKVIEADVDATQVQVDEAVAVLTEAIDGMKLVGSGSYSLTAMGDAGVIAGQTFDVTYILGNVAAFVYALDQTIHYDPTQVEFLSVEAQQSGFSIVGQKEDEGQIRILMASAGSGGAIKHTSPVLKLHFKAKEGSQNVTSSIFLTDVAVAGANGIEMPVSNGSAYTIQIIVVDKAALQALISSAQELHDAAVEGAAISQYPVGTKAILQAAIASAKAIADQNTATQEQVDQAIAQLEAALQAFTASVNVAAPGDLNADGKFSIGDLGLISASYGKTFADADWDKYQKADLNGDGKIDIVDLAAIASLVLG